MSLKKKDNVNLKCKDCKKIKPPPIYQMTNETIKVSQFQLTKTPDIKINKNGNSIRK